MHLLQIRRKRRGGEARRRLHTALERRQREDLRVSLVLVPLSRHAELRHDFIQGKRLFSVSCTVQAPISRVIGRQK